MGFNVEEEYCLGLIFSTIYVLTKVWVSTVNETGPWVCRCLNKVAYFVWLVNWLFNIIRMGTYNALNNVIILETSVWTSKLFAGKERVHLDQELRRPRTNSFICFFQYPSSSSCEDHHWFLLYKPAFFTSLIWLTFLICAQFIECSFLFFVAQYFQIFTEKLLRAKHRKTGWDSGIKCVYSCFQMHSLLNFAVEVSIFYVDQTCFLPF